MNQRIHSCESLITLGLGGGGVGGGHLNCALGAFLCTLVYNYTPVVLRLQDVSIRLGIETTICGMSLGA